MPARSSKLPSRPKDANELAKAIVDAAMGIVDVPETEDGRNAAAVALGRLGGLKGGKARAASLSKTERSEIARRAATVRWAKKNKKS